MGVEQPSQFVDAALCRGIEDGVDRLPHLRRVGGETDQVAREQLDRLVPFRLGDLVDGAAVVVGGVRVEAGVEGAPHGFDVARPRGGEDPLAAHAVDMGLELAPAREAVVAGDHELCRGQLGVWVCGPERAEPLLGLAFEVFEVRPFRQIAAARRSRAGYTSHKTFLPMRPASVYLGQEVRFRCDRTLRRAAPFTRTVGRRYGGSQR
jgi:hypothetical protein